MSKFLWRQRRKVAFVLALAMVFLNTKLLASAAENDTGITCREVELQGISMEAEEFQQAYVPELNTEVLGKFTLEEELYLKEVVCEDGRISMKAQLVNAEGQVVDFGITGDLYSGFKKEAYDLPSVVVDVEDSQNKVDVLYFEIMNATNDKILYVDQNLKEVPNMKIYLTYDGKLYLFEKELPLELRGITNSGLEQMMDNFKDMLWFAPYAPGEIREIDAEDFYSPEELLEMQALGSITSWTGGTVYQYRFISNGSTYLHNSMPFGTYETTNNVDSHNSTWSAYFYVNESVLADGKKVNLPNLIRYKNVEISMACGKETHIINTSLAGRIYEVKGGANSASAAFDVFTSSIPWWSTGQQILSILTALADSGGDIELGTKGFDIPSPGITAVGVKTGAKYLLFNNAYESGYLYNIHETANSHALKFQGTVKSNGDSGSSSTNTTGCIQFKWDAYENANFGQLATNAKKTFTFSYIVR